VAKANLQTVIVPKKLAASRSKATKLARRHANRIYTSRETGQSYRFRQRPPTDFVKSSFRTVKLPDGISLVYGKLKPSAIKKDGRKRNPQLEFEYDPKTLESEQKFLTRFCGKVDKAKSAKELVLLAAMLRERDLKSSTITRLAADCLVKKAAKHKLCRFRGTKYVDSSAKAFDMYEEDVKKCIHELLEMHRKENPKKKKTKNKSKKKSKKPSYIKLKSPKVLPDPGPCAVLGTSKEFKWSDGKRSYMWCDGRESWLFLWCPKYKAVIAIKKPKHMRRLPDISKKGGAARAYKRFMARDPENTYEIDMYGYPLKKMGKACHYVYWSDKWNDDSEYIHDLGKGVELYCGPTKKKPEVFLCVGGKLTLTERGLVY